MKGKIIMKSLFKILVFSLVIIFLFLTPMTSISDTIPKQVKIMFYDISFSMLDENSSIHPPMSWYLEKKEPTTTINKLISQGWELKQIVPINGKQGYLYFAK